MKARHIVMLTIVVASVGALFSTTRHSERSLNSDHHHNAVGAPLDTEHDELDHRNAVAVEDMLHHAVKYLGTAAAIPESFVALHQWQPSWELRWMDFHHDDHTVRVYHATHHEHHETRYAIVSDTQHGALDHHHWKRVH